MKKYSSTEYNDLTISEFLPHEGFKPNQELIDLTNKFLKEFVWLYAKLENKKAKDEESFAFHYILSECLVHSEININDKSRERVLLGMSTLEQNLTKGMFELNMKGVFSDLLFILQNIDKQPKYEDYQAKVIKDTTKTITVEAIDIHVMLSKDKTKSAFFDKQVEERIIELQFSNSKNGHSEIAVMHFHDNELEKVNVLEDQRQTILRINGREQPKIEHFKYVADINSFLYCLDQVYALTKEKLSRKK